MDTVIKDYLEQLKVGRKQVYKNLAIYPILTHTLRAWNTYSWMKP